MVDNSALEVLKLDAYGARIVTVVVVVLVYLVVLSIERLLKLPDLGCKLGQWAIPASLPVASTATRRAVLCKNNIGRFGGRWIQTDS